MIHTEKHPLLKQCFDLCHAIERCGIGPELSNAAHAAAQLLHDLEAHLTTPALDDDAEVSDRLGAWLSAALDDSHACEEFKRDVRAWFDAGRPGFTLDKELLDD